MSSQLVIQRGWGSLCAVEDLVLDMPLENHHRSYDNHRDTIHRLWYGLRRQWTSRMRHCGWVDPELEKQLWSNQVLGVLGTERSIFLGQLSNKYPLLWTSECLCVGGCLGMDLSLRSSFILQSMSKWYMFAGSSAASNHTSRLDKCSSSVTAISFTQLPAIEIFCFPFAIWTRYPYPCFMYNPPIKKNLMQWKITCLAVFITYQIPCLTICPRPAAVRTHFV